jgi:hypothetical protein
VLDFLLTQGTSASAKQHSVLVIHNFSLFVNGPVERAQALQVSLFGGAGRSRTRLAANLTDVLISIRRRRGCAE